MKHINIKLLILLFVINSFTVFGQKERKVLFIGIDGVRQDALAQAHTPNIDKLAANGISTYDSWHMGITSSGPSWSSMMTGVWEAKHKITNNSYTGANFGEYPYFSKRAKEVNPNLKAVQIVTWNPMAEAGINPGGNVFNSDWDRSIDPGDLGQGVVTATAKIQLLDPDLDILFIHYDEVDAAGHGFGFDPEVPQYINAIEHADEEIGEVMEALKARANYANEDWLILSTTDHGGNGFGHGGNSNIERHIWWYASNENLPSVILTGEDPGSYQMPNNPVDEDILANTPVLTDIAVTALDWILPDTDPEEVEEWDLDGKSWINRVTAQDEYSIPAQNVLIYPNPASDLITVRFNDVKSQISASIISTTGKTLKSVEIETFNSQAAKNINISDLAPGIYFLKVEMNNSIISKRIIKL